MDATEIRRRFMVVTVLVGFTCILSVLTFVVTVIMLAVMVNLQDHIISLSNHLSQMVPK